MFGSKSSQEPAAIDGKSYLGLRGEKLQQAIGAIAGIGFLLFGYDQGVMGGLLTLKSFYTTFPEIDTVTTTGAQNSHNATLQGAAIALYEIGCFMGALSVMKFGDLLGRRKTIFVGSIIMVIGAAIQTASYSLAQLIVARIITGFGNGFITSTVPTWQSECSPAHKRGRLVMIEGALITGGVCISYWIDFAFYWVPESGAAWRVPVAFQILFALIIIAFVLFLPESPRWLIRQGKYEEAAQVFAALQDVPLDHPYVAQAVQTVRDTLPPSGNQGVRRIFKNGNRRHFHRACLGIVNQCFQQISGINLITYYAATIFESYIGLSPTLSRILAACNGTEYFLASWIAVYTIEKIGRRPLMLFGAAGMAASMAILAGTASISDTSTGAAITAAVFLFVFNTFFAIGWLGMTWLYPAEIVSLEVRAASNGISTASNWIFNFMVVMITPVAFANIGYQTYIIFAVINGCLILPVTWYAYPETKGRSLEEIDTVFENVRPGWRSIRDAVLVERQLPYVDHAHEAEKAGFGDPNALGRKLSVDHNENAMNKKPSMGEKHESA